MQQYPIRSYIRKYLTPCFPRLRTRLGFLRRLRYQGREDFLLGILQTKQDVLVLQGELEKRGFEVYCVAWIDIGEVLGMRKSDGFEYQYHLRIFVDGEVRGHYELTPEYAWFRHFFDFEKYERREEFLAMIGDLVK